jgi:hypothetical protein
MTIGKTKETFSYELVGDSANLPQMERVLNPFLRVTSWEWKPCGTWVRPCSSSTTRPGPTRQRAATRSSPVIT